MFGKRGFVGGDRTALIHLHHIYIDHLPIEALGWTTEKKKQNKEKNLSNSALTESYG